MNQRFLDQTYYEILEIRPDAPENEIHRAYLKAKDTYSPDSPALYTMFSPEEAHELSRLIEEAYSVLSNHAARREYDHRLLGRNNEVYAIQQNTRPSNTQTFNYTKVKSDKVTTPYPSSKEQVPAGFAKCKFGIYKINPDFEKLIEDTHEFTGEFLAKIRSYKQISLEDLSDDIRVSRSYLRAIEGDEYSGLPADVFVRGFVLQYAKALGLSAEPVANSYMKILRNVRKK